MDLGATPGQALRRVLLPLLAPAIMAAAVLVFADAVDNFVTVRYLSGPASSEPLSGVVPIRQRSENSSGQLSKLNPNWSTGLTSRPGSSGWPSGRFS